MVRLSARHSIFYNVGRKKTCNRCLIDLRHRLAYTTPTRDYCLDCSIITNQIATVEEFVAIKEAIGQIKRQRFSKIALSPLIDSQLLLIETPKNKPERNQLMVQYRNLGYDTETATKKRKQSERIIEALKKTNRALTDFGSL